MCNLKENHFGISREIYIRFEYLGDWKTMSSVMCFVLYK